MTKTESSMEFFVQTIQEKNPRHVAQQQAIDELKIFVESTCSTRPPSHNHIHMFRVMENAISITHSLIFLIYMLSTLLVYVALVKITSLYFMSVLLTTCVIVYREVFVLVDMFDSQTLLYIVKVVALLHDVTDHKYVKKDSVFKKQFSEYLKEFTTRKNTVDGTIYKYLFTQEMIENIISRVSYSAQKKNGTDDWIPVLGYLGCLVRAIVSDADKLEAIGLTGFLRCVSYTVEVLNSEQKLATAEKVYPLVEQHYNEKLKTIASLEYMKTPFGWFQARLEDRRMVKKLKEFQAECRENPTKLISESFNDF
jgi:hypothetical protein